MKTKYKTIPSYAANLLWVVNFFDGCMGNGAATYRLRHISRHSLTLAKQHHAHRLYQHKNIQE